MYIGSSRIMCTCAQYKKNEWNNHGYFMGLIVVVVGDGMKQLPEQVWAFDINL